MIKILVVEDEKVSAEFIADILRQEDYIVHIANSGTQALQMIANNSYNLVFLDLIMPGIDGL